MFTKKNKIFATLFCLLTFIFFIQPVYAESIPDKPPLTGVYDPHGYLSDDVVKEVAILNQSYSKTKLKPQIAVAIVDEVDGDIESVANKTAKNWQVGFSDTNYGTLVLISVKERKIRTETSNNMGLIIPDSEARLLNDSVKDDFRNKDYSAGVLKYISLFKEKVESYANGNSQVSKDEKTNLDEKPKKIKLSDYPHVLFLVGGLFVFFIAIIFINEVHNTSLRQRMDYDYEGKDKMYPDHPYFIPNESWTDERIEEYKRQKAEEFALRSDYSYKGSDKLYPNNAYFVDNPSWTPELVSSFYAEKSHYSGHSDSSFSSSSSSSSSWSGGGFDGGGSTGGW